MNIPIGLTALALLCWSLQYFQLERNMSDFTLAALRTELVRDFDFIGVQVPCLFSQPYPRAHPMQFSFDLWHGIYCFRI